MFERIASSFGGARQRTTTKIPLKRKTFLRLAVAGVAGVIFVTGNSVRNSEFASAQRAPDAAASVGPEAKVTPLMSKDLADLPGKEGLLMTVEYPPGSVDPVHRHHAHGFIYVLEGSIVMQVKGGKQVTLNAGDNFYEGSDDVHTVGRNASTTQPARFVVFFVKDKGAPVLVSEK